MSSRLLALMIVVGLLQWNPVYAQISPDVIFQLGNPDDEAQAIHFDVVSETLRLLTQSEDNSVVKLFEVTDSSVVETILSNQTHAYNFSDNGRFLVASQDTGPAFWIGNVYETSDVTTPFRTFSDVQAIDVANNGDAVGIFETNRPAVLTNDGITRLDFPDRGGTATAISSDGRIITGTILPSLPASQSRASLWENDNLSFLDEPEGTIFASAHALSPNGNFVSGVLISDEGIRTPVWENGEFLGLLNDEFGIPLLSSGSLNGSNGITDNGLVIANSIDGPYVWWPELASQRPLLELDPFDAVPFEIGFPDFDLGDFTLRGINDVFADGQGFIHFAFLGSAGYGFTEDPTLSTDFDSDGDVDGADFLIWQRGVAIGATFAEGDANEDGTVDGSDLSILLARYGGNAVANASAVHVPEPSSVVLLLLGSLAGKACIRRVRAS